ncbi:MAG: hypothetical protein ACPGD5_01420 [Salibacteraceae bacterium]
MTDEYIPVDCSLHDKLLEFATFKKKVEIQFQNKNEVLEIESVIKDVYTSKTKEEFLVTDRSLEIRLDHLIQVGGVLKPTINFCDVKQQT